MPIDLHGRNLTLVAEHWPPFFEYLPSDGTSGPRHAGMMWELLVLMANVMNFKFNIIKSHDGKWGVGDENGTWNGMLGMVKRKEVEFAIGPFAVIYEREQGCCTRNTVVDLTFPVTTSYWTSFVPVNIKQDELPYLRPFEMNFWAAFFPSVIVVALILTVFDRIFKRVTRWDRHVGFVTRTAFIQPAYWYPREHGYQAVVVMAWFGFMFVVGHSYSGQLISMLTVPQMITPINSAEELVAQDELPFAIEEATFLEQIGSVSPPDSLWGRLYAKAFLDRACYDITPRMIPEQFGQICDTITMQMLIAEDFSATSKCNYYAGHKYFIGTPFAMAFQNGSELLPEVNTFILKLHQMGFIEILMNRLMSNASYCEGISNIVASHGNLSNKITMQQTAGIFFLYLVGLAFSLIAFLAEVTLGK